MTEIINGGRPVTPDFVPIRARWDPKTGRLLGAWEIEELEAKEAAAKTAAFREDIVEKPAIRTWQRIAWTAGVGLAIGAAIGAAYYFA